MTLERSLPADRTAFSPLRTAKPLDAAIDGVGRVAHRLGEAQYGGAKLATRLFHGAGKGALSFGDARSQDSLHLGLHRGGGFQARAFEALDRLAADGLRGSRLRRGEVAAKHALESFILGLRRRCALLLELVAHAVDMRRQTVEGFADVRGGLFEGGSGVADLARGLVTRAADGSADRLDLEAKGCEDFAQAPELVAAYFLDGLSGMPHRRCRK